MDFEADLPSPSYGSEISYSDIISMDADDICFAQIKDEITVEDEIITETTFAELNIEELHEDEEIPEEVIYHQVEVGINVEAPEEDSSKDNNNHDNIIGEMCELQRTEVEPESEISDALNDHNYTSHEFVTTQPKLDVKDILLSQIVSNGTVPPNVSNFIDNTINQIKLLQLENADKANETIETTETTEVGETKVITTFECSTENKKQNDDNMTLPNDCSEPLEVEANDEYFESLYKNETEQKMVSKSNLTDTTDFAKEFYNECNAMTTLTEEEYKTFISEKIKKLQKIANILNTSDQSVQTFSKSSLKKRRRINHKAKRNLFNSDSSDSSNIDSESADSFDDDQNNDLSSEKKSLARPCLKKREVEYDDGIDLSKYIKLDIPNKKCREVSCDFENKDKDAANSCSSEDNNTDKEIDRLINLNALKKRHGHTSNVQPKDKQKPKTLSTKPVNNLNELDDDLEMSGTDNSFKESEEEVITENQYLSRFNEQIKMQLLNESNSDSGLSDQSDYNLSKEASSSEDETKADVVDKFLQVFNCENDDVPKEDSLNESKESKFDLEGITKESDSFEVSDEVWNDDLLQKKRSKKSLEKLLAEAEKRNQNEEIVLSSESEYSDAEKEAVEEKTRLIKPMLRMDQLANETRAAQKSESERIRRLDKKHVILSKAVKNNSGNLNKSGLILDYIEKTKTFIKVDEEIVKQLKPHQIDGIKFMYDSCYGGIDHAKKNTGSGCILAHCMGLGKTLQLIALLNTVITYKELNTSKVLVLCPKSTVMNWADELQRWLGPLKSKTPIKVFVFPDSSDIAEKLRVLEQWSLSSANKAGCLLVGYEAFRTLVFYHSYKNRGNLSSAKLESIRDKVNKYLLQPGADLVVCDEGHIIKNSKSAISLAVAKIITPKRIILTGTPIQNNLKEYYSMVNFIKPLYLGTEKEFANLYANPIKNGQHKDSSKKDITVMKQRSYVLHKKLSKFVQRKEAELLKTFLPQKFEYVLFIPMTAVQNTLYEYILEAIASRGDSRGKSLITDYTVLRKIWTHPKVLEDAWKNANMQKNRKETKKVGCPHSDDDQPDDIYDSQTGLISVTNDWWRKYLSKKDLETIMPSNKLRTMFSILRMCEEKGEKCLIFSAFVAVLNVVEYFFKKITECDPEILQHIHAPTSLKTTNTWINGQDYYRLDGKTPKNIRHEMIKRFNSESNRRARVFLISAKAGGQGINLIGANRVIILDTSWNPSNDQQNIFRIFRLGQKKNCYIYRLIAMGTMEEKVYSRSVTKQAMSFRVVDEQQIDRHYNMAELAELYTLTNPKQSERTMPLLPKDTILAHLLRQSELVYKYHEHDSLLENKVEQELSEQEKADAWDTYEREQQMNLAQQEGLTADKMQNPALNPKLNPYLGAVPSLDMQSLLNYRLQQSVSMMPQYNYGLNGLSQNYIDTLNLYQKFSSMRYPDMLNEAGFNPSPFGVMNPANLNPMQPNAPIMPNLQAVPPTNKSHSRDFGMFDPQNARNNVIGQQQLHHSISQQEAAAVAAAAAAASLANSTANTNANNMLSNLGRYKQMLENPLTSLLNYSAQSYAPPAQAENLQASLKASAIYGQKVADAAAAAAVAAAAAENLHKKDKTTKLKSSHEQNMTQRGAITPPSAPVTPSVDLTISAPVTLTGPNPFAKNLMPPSKKSVVHTTGGTVDLTTPPSMPTPHVSVNLVKNSSHMKKAPALPNMQRQINLAMQSEDDKNSKNAKAANVSYPPRYSNDRGSTLSKDFLKSNAEMQIIPTTSPPGTISITKQLNEMSPSISLTAVNPLTEKSKSRTQVMPKNSSSVLSTSTSNFKPKKSSNSNIFSLSKSTSPAVLATTKNPLAKDKSLPVSFPQSKKTPTDLSALFKPDISKTLLTPAKTGSGKKITNSDTSNLAKKTGHESIANAFKALSDSLVANKTTVTESPYKVKPINNPQTSIVNIRSTNSSNNDLTTDINLGENMQNFVRKRSADSPKPNNTNIKRTKV